MHELLSKLESLQLLSTDQRSIIEIEHRRTRQSIDSLLMENGFITAERLHAIERNEYHLQLDIDEFVPDAEAVSLLAEEDARHLQALPLSFDDKLQLLTLGICSSNDVLLRDRLRRLIPGSVNIAYRILSAADLVAALDRCYGVCLTLNGILQEIEQGATHSTMTHEFQMPVVRLVDAILHDAVTRRSSDIHLSPEEHFVRIRYRIDGVLIPQQSLHKSVWSAMIVRIKVLSGMDIAESRMPQDGHVSKRIHGEKIDFRVSSFPLRTGENVVLRVLDKRRGIQRLSDLRLPTQQLDQLRNLLAQPHGMTLVCGPTGSGKTTTLYALLNELENDSLNVMTLEDPIEYPMLRVCQAAVDISQKLDFVSGVRGLLRQDPDVLLIGEIRDSESSAMAFRATMSGHQVLSTVHASNAIAALSRLLELGIERSLLVNNLTGVIAQRLLRRCCVHCSKAEPATTDICKRCHGTGYYGRLALLEILTITPAIAQLVLSEASTGTLVKQAVKDGLCNLHDVAEGYVANGLTDSREVDRVLGKNCDSSTTTRQGVSEHDGVSLQSN